MARTQPALATQWPQTPAERILRPIQEFVQQSTSGGIVLIVATLIALVLANSPLAPSYFSILDTKVGLNFGQFVFQETVLHWINDGLMAIFFFLVGLEIKREILVGELSSVRAAALPVIAAVGGAVVPALLYVAFTFGRPGSSGWAIPMATDIAFALGALSLLSKRVPFGLKIFLTAVAIADDLIAVMMIAIFYTSQLNFLALGVGAAVLVVCVFANILGLRKPLIYIVLGVIVWVAFLESGIHATIAGVLIAWTIPARSRIKPNDFLAHTRSLLNQFEQSSDEPTKTLTVEHQEAVVRDIEDLSEAVQAPLQRIEHNLNPWVAFGIMPVFALANAGVVISLGTLNATTLPVALGIIVGLVIGKPIGMLVACWVVVRANIGALPQGVRWSHMVGAGFFAGIGFTMSLFITSLAFSDATMQDAAKLGVLAASLIAGSIGFSLLLRQPASPPTLEG